MTDLLFATPGNPIPENAHAGILKARDGKRLRFARFGASARPLQGTVIILPGRNECIEKYFETIGDLARRGLGSAILDWRGQGGSDRLIRDPQRGHIGDFQIYLRDLEQFFEEVVLPDCRGPYYMLGHSTGSLIAIMAAPSMLNRIRRMVLVAPLISLHGLPLSPGSVSKLTSTLYWVGFGRSYFGGGKRPLAPLPFAGNKVTSDPIRYQRNVMIYEEQPALAIGGPTVSWVRAMLRAAYQIQQPAFRARIQIPMLFVAAGADTIVSTPAIEAYARTLRSGAVITIDGSRHEILQEADLYREQFLAAFDAFVPGTGE
ncbi:MAG: alpha/beta hydrolase [Rhizobiaceae bacterium]|nr:alpha/beta hydrolase [Rhizobiaceae bacterium]